MRQTLGEQAHAEAGDLAVPQERLRLAGWHHCVGNHGLGQLAALCHIVPRCPTAPRQQRPSFAWSGAVWLNMARYGDKTSIIKHLIPFLSGAIWSCKAQGTPLVRERS